MAYFHTNYDASTMTVSVNDEEVSRALGVLSNKTPAALKVAVNTTARQTRKLMLTEVKNRYDLNAAGRRLLWTITEAHPHIQMSSHFQICPLLF